MNKKGYPVLPKILQNLVKKFYPLRVQFLIEGRNMGQDMALYQQYLSHLFKQEEEAVNSDPLRKYASGYEDFLQNPLQPLMDNLESGTYEVFEKDPVKYREYQNAIYRALIDRVPEEEAKTKEVLIMVLGAGRGPLVTASLKVYLLSKLKQKCLYSHVFRLRREAAEKLKSLRWKRTPMLSSLS